jgi:aryl-alcohol dehydrogenase-like predicted oxidoreductase
MPAGRSERLIGRFLAENPDTALTVATKIGRRVQQVPDNYVLDNFRSRTDRSAAISYWIVWT